MKDKRHVCSNEMNGVSCHDAAGKTMLGWGQPVQLIFAMNGHTFNATQIIMVEGNLYCLCQHTPQDSSISREHTHISACVNIHFRHAMLGES